MRRMVVEVPRIAPAQEVVDTDREKFRRGAAMTTEIDPTSTDFSVDFDDAGAAFGPDVISKLPELTALDLQYIRPDYKLPRELLSLTKLKKLELMAQDDNKL